VVLPPSMAWKAAVTRKSDQRLVLLLLLLGGHPRVFGLLFLCWEAANEVDDDTSWDPRRPFPRRRRR